MKPVAASDSSRPRPQSWALFLFACVSAAGILHAAADCGAFQRSEFQYCNLLTPSLVLHWSVADGNITLAMEDTAWTATAGEGSHWLGLGLSEGGSMAGADMMVLIKGPPTPQVSSQAESTANSSSSAGRSNSVWTVQDMHSYANGAVPRSDGVQNVQLMGQPVEAGGRLLAVMRRPLQTCDGDDRAIVQGMWTHVIWARGARWPSYHGPINRGSAILTLYPYDKQTVESQTASNKTADPGLQLFNLTMPNIVVPSVNVTNYICSHVEVSVTGKQHIVGFVPIVQNQKLVHHMVLYSCATPPAQTGDVFDCMRMDEGCQVFTIGWAPGVKSVDLHASAGFPVGGTSHRFYSLQYLLDDLMTQLTAVIVSTLGLSNAIYWLLLSHTQQYTELQSAALAFVADRYQEIRYAEDGSAAQLKMYPELLLALMDQLPIRH